MAEDKQSSTKQQQRNKSRRTSILDNFNNFRKALFHRKHNSTTTTTTNNEMSQNSVKTHTTTNGSNQNQTTQQIPAVSSKPHDGSKREPKIYTASCNTHNDKIMSDGGGAAPATPPPKPTQNGATAAPASADKSSSKQEASGSSSGSQTAAAPAKPPQTAFDSASALLAQYGYGLGEQLGKGSYAIVRAATSKKHKRRVAIKIISKKKAPEDYLTKFLPREIQVLKRLRHPNCISLLEAIETNTRIYLIMNLAENGDLLEYIRERGPMPDDDARRYFRHLITAIEYFHSLGIVHRDLKCENLLLDVNFNLVVSDFGFARGQMVNPETGKRRLSQTFCGSYAYAPPEILRGIAYDGTIADIWSVGVILYTMVSASLPFDDSNLKTLLEQVMRPVHFSSRKKITPEAKDLICKMLIPSVDKRFTIQDIKQHCWFKGEKLPATGKDDATPPPPPPQQPIV